MLENHKLKNLLVHPLDSKTWRESTCKGVRLFVLLRLCCSAYRIVVNGVNDHLHQVDLVRLDLDFRVRQSTHCYLDLGSVSILGYKFALSVLQMRQRIGQHGHGDSA